MSVRSTAETVAIVCLLVVLVLRQFQWKTASAARLLRLPAILILVGTVGLGRNLSGGETLTRGAIGILTVELVLVSVIGVIMGRLSMLRAIEGQEFYRQSSIGILLWALFLLVRIGSFALARAFGIHILETTGVILISFGLNRLASALVIRRRLMAELQRPSERSYTGTERGSALHRMIGR